MSTVLNTTSLLRPVLCNVAAALLGRVFWLTCSWFVLWIAPALHIQGQSVLS